MPNIKFNKSKRQRDKEANHDHRRERHTHNEVDATVLSLALIILAAIVVKCKYDVVTATTAEDSRFSLRVGGHSSNQNGLNFIMRYKANRISSLLRDLLVERERERDRKSSCKHRPRF